MSSKYSIFLMFVALDLEVDEPPSAPPWSKCSLTSSRQAFGSTSFLALGISILVGTPTMMFPSSGISRCDAALSRILDGS